MKNNGSFNIRGDCPNLDNGPVSTEHVLRFQKQNVQQGMYNGTLSPNAQNMQKRENEKANPS